MGGSMDSMDQYEKHGVASVSSNSIDNFTSEHTSMLAHQPLSIYISIKTFFF